MGTTKPTLKYGPDRPTGRFSKIAKTTKFRGNLRFPLRFPLRIPPIIGPFGGSDTITT